MNVDDIVAERIAAARRRAEADKQRRQELAEARQHGLAARHAQKLRRQATAQAGPTNRPPAVTRRPATSNEEKHMKIATGNVHHVAPCPPGWLVVLNNGADQEQEIVCPLIGWATVVEAHLADGTTSTADSPRSCTSTPSGRRASCASTTPSSAATRSAAARSPGARSPASDPSSDWPAPQAPGPAHSTRSQKGSTP
ncbi:hypothetical protein SVIOM342S_07646 [Streptomyces violaceorubidus]